MTRPTVYVYADDYPWTTPLSTGLLRLDCTLSHCLHAFRPIFMSAENVGIRVAPNSASSCIAILTARDQTQAPWRSTGKQYSRPPLPCGCPIEQTRRQNAQVLSVICITNESCAPSIRSHNKGPGHGQYLRCHFLQQSIQEKLSNDRTCMLHTIQLHSVISQIHFSPYNRFCMISMTD